MFTLDCLRELEPSFRVISSRDKNPRVATLCSLDSLCEQGLIFVKNNKFYRKLLALSRSRDLKGKITVVFQESFFRQIHVDDELEMFSQLGSYATVASVDLAISSFSKLFFDEFQKKGNDLVDGRQTGSANIHPTCTIADGVFLGEGVEIAPHVTIHPGCVVLSHSRIGAKSVLYPNVVIYRKVTIGQDCIIHANATIGSDGFGYNRHEGVHLKVWHFGGVLIEDSVEIGANTSIDQGTFSPTVIGRGSKIDNQVQIAHNCHLGKGVIVCGQIGFSGSVKVGDYVVMGGAAGVAQDVEIGNYAQIAGMAGVTGNVPEKASYAGHPARPIKEWLRSVAILRQLSLRKKGMRGGGSD